MKRTLLFLLMMVAFSVYSQTYRNGIEGYSVRMPEPLVSYQVEEGIKVDPLTTGVTVQVLPPERGSSYINPVSLGQAGNAFGFAYTRNTFLWADQNINSITFIHRMINPPGTGYLAYDISKDGGLTWTNNIQTYDPTLPDAFNGRYPQGAIYNPVGNTDPDNAYFHYFAPTLDGSNTGGANNWGGYGYGVKQLADGSTPTQTNKTSVPPFYLYLPAAFTVTQTGHAWMADEHAQGDASGYNNLGELILGHGIWNESLEDFDYSFSFIPLEIDPDDGINDMKIAFSPDGQTGWLMALTNLPENLPYTSYHPVLFKTTDGGENWEGPIEVQLGGEYGLAPIKEFITDEMLATFFDPEPVPPRDEIDYYIGYEGDLVVDAWGNPHINGMVCISDNIQGLIYPNEGLMAMFHIWSEDMGANWNAYNLSDLRRFKAIFTDSGGGTMEMYNRPQAATTMDGAIVFFSWLDTENPDVEDNSQPDIFIREYFPTMETHSESTDNVTTFSAAMWNAFYGCMSHYVFAEVTESQYTCTIPFVYEQFTNFDPQLPVQFYYIPDYIKSYTVTSTSIEENEIPQGLVVTQNYPNPANGSTKIGINLPYKSNLTLEVFNIAGSRIYTENLGYHDRGWKEFTIDPNHWNPGIYFYIISSEQEKVTRKMIITD